MDKHFTKHSTHTNYTW